MGRACRVGEPEDERYEGSCRYRESEQRANRTARNKCRSGQTGQNRTRSPEARKRVSEPEYGEAQRWPSAALTGLMSGEGLREPRDGVETRGGKQVELKETEQDQDRPHDCTEDPTGYTSERYALDECAAAQGHEKSGNEKETESP